MLKLPDFIGRKLIKSRLDKIEKERGANTSDFKIFSKKLVINTVMNKLEEGHRKGKIDDFHMLSMLLVLDLGHKEEKEINRIAKILKWKEFRAEDNWWGKREILMAIKNRTLGSEADELVEDFKIYCEESGKEFPDITKGFTGGDDVGC